MASIKKRISSIHFLGKDKTKVMFRERFKPREYNEVINEENPRTSDFKRHRNFDDAMKVFAVHLITRLGFAEPTDRLGKVITLQNSDFFTENIYLDDPRFKNIEVTSVIITTKTDATRFKINGTITLEDGEKQKLSCPSINTLKKTDGGWNYPLADFAQIHIETLLNEAEQWLHYKSDQLKIDFNQREDVPEETGKPKKEKGEAVNA